MSKQLYLFELKQLRDGCEEEKLDTKVEALDAAIEALSAQPEIIRCNDCTWWSNDEYRECSSPNYDNVHVTPAGFYCGYAERRTDDSISD